eukprot:Nk52_evm39s152 gene=Nk52_evmTU39s152
MAEIEGQGSDGSGSPEEELTENPFLKKAAVSVSSVLMNSLANLATMEETEGKTQDKETLDTVEEQAEVQVTDIERKVPSETKDKVNQDGDGKSGGESQEDEFAEEETHKEAEVALKSMINHSLINVASVLENQNFEVSKSEQTNENLSETIIAEEPEIYVKEDNQIASDKEKNTKAESSPVRNCDDGQKEVPINEQKPEASFSMKEKPKSGIRGTSSVGSVPEKKSNVKQVSGSLKKERDDKSGARKVKEVDVSKEALSAELKKIEKKKKEKLLKIHKRRSMRERAEKLYQQKYGGTEEPEMEELTIHKLNELVLSNKSPDGIQAKDEDILEAKGAKFQAVDDKDDGLDLELELDNDFHVKLASINHEQERKKEIILADRLLHGKYLSSKKLIENVQPPSSMGFYDHGKKVKYNLQDNSDHQSHTKIVQTLSQMKDSDSWKALHYLTQLKERNAELMEATVRDSLIIEEMQAELRMLRKSMNESKPFVTGDLGGVGVAAKGREELFAKYKELSKRHRESTALLEAEKSQNKRLQEKISQLEMKLSKRDSTETSKGFSHIENKKKIEELKNKGEKMYNNVQEEESENPAELKAKINSHSMKIVEQKHAIESLKKDLSLAHRALEKELGENYSIKKILVSSSSWKGRSQQIFTLRTKVNELQEELLKCKSRGEDIVPKQPIYVSKSNDRDVKAKQGLKRIEANRQEMIDSLKDEIERLKEDKETLKAKCEASNIRKNHLGNELKSAKVKINALKEKGDHDDELIQELKSHLVRLSKKDENIHQQPLKTASVRIVKNDDELEANKLRCKQLQEDFYRAQETIAKLRKDLREARVDKISELQESAFNTKVAGLDREIETLNNVVRAARLKNEKTTALVASLENELRTLKAEMKGKGKNSKIEGQKVKEKEGEHSAALRKLTILEGEKDSLKATLAATIATKDQEIQMYHELLKESKIEYDRTIKEILRRTRESRKSKNSKVTTPIQQGHSPVSSPSSAQQAAN